MRRKHISIVRYLFPIFLLLYFGNFRPSGAGEAEYLRGCTHLHCESGSQCIKRRFWCKNPPCPGMLYCSKTRKESLKGPLTCDTVHCSSGHICVIKVQGCRWDEKCQQQIARCVPEKEYHEGAVSCAGFKCPAGERCVLRESPCVNPPCKLVRSCADVNDVQIWFDKCKALDCLSEYDCFLRRTSNDCQDATCERAPDCIFTAEDELISKYCRGWICPRMQKCTVQIVGSCKGFNCTIKRTCRPSTVASKLPANQDTFTSKGWSTERTTVQNETVLSREEVERRGMSTPTRYPTTRKKTTSTATSARKQTDYTTSHIEHGTEFSVIHLQATTKTTSTFSDPPKNSGYPTNSSTEQRVNSVASYSTTKLEMLKKIYIATDDAVPLLPVVLEGINFVAQGYPIWIESELRRSPPLGAENEDDSGWRYYVPREPYRILLPPYEPVILVENTRRGQLPPFFAYALGHSFNEAALLSLKEIPSRGTTENPGTTNSTTNTVDEVRNNNTSVSATIEMENLGASYSDAAPDDYANLGATKKTDIAPADIRGNESSDYYDDYEGRPWHAIRYPQKKPQSAHEKESTSSIEEFATDDSHQNGTRTSTDVETLARGQIANENRGRASDTQYTHRYNKNLTKPDAIGARLSTAQEDYSYEDNEERYDLAKHFYDAITIHGLDKSKEHRKSDPNKISDVSRDQQPTTFSFGELDERRSDVQPTAAFLQETSPYLTYNDNNQKNDDREYDEYYSHESYDGISDIEMTGS